MTEGPWAQPRIYPDMAGMLDNPDAAYAKLREIGKGLFGPNDGLNDILGGTGGTGTTGQNEPLGGQRGQTLGNLIQQGQGRNRSIPPIPTPQSQVAPQPQQPDGSSTQAEGNEQESQQDSQQMNDVLRQLFGR
jgi:AsmA protein